MVEVVAHSLVGCIDSGVVAGVTVAALLMLDRQFVGRYLAGLVVGKRTVGGRAVRQGRRHSGYMAHGYRTLGVAEGADKCHWSQPVDSFVEGMRIGLAAEM